MGNLLNKGLFFLLVLAVTYLVKLPAPEGKTAYPNVVLLIIDTLRADKLGCYGFSENTSPELDNIARKGVIFKNTFAQSSWTRPSHGSFLTALYPRTIGIYKQKYDILNDKFNTMAELLKKAGYTTLGITANPHINAVFNFHQGFDKYIDSVVVVDWMIEKYKLKGKKVYSKKTPISSIEYILDRTMEMVNSVDGTPVYLQINIMDIHDAIKKDIQHGLRPEFKELFKDSGYPKRYAKYYRVVRQVSYDVGKFIGKLTAVPGWENTLFIITSDHGEGLFDHGGVKFSQGHAFLLYASNMWVPYILYHHGDGLKPKIINRPVRLMDMMPTVLDYLGLPVPNNLDGVSLLRMIHGNESDVALPEYFVAETQYDKSNKIAVYSKDWEYIENRDDLPVKKVAVNKVELQPAGIKEKGVLTDMVDKKPEIVKRMKKFLDRWERKYPKRKKTDPQKSPSPEEIKQLKSLGYIQ